MRKRGRHYPWVAAAAVSLLISVSLSLLSRLPAPQFHDEFSYLLAGDTFVHARLTNPAHPMARFFETFQVLQAPSYASKYPPLQGMFLALGKRLTSEPIVGVWISTALACAAAAWALTGFMPRRWALLGALVIASHPMLLQWNWSYWGGAAAMIGGCLVVGALVRGSAPILALGAIILLASRPFEGIVLLALTTTLLRKCVRHRFKPGQLHVLLAALILTLGGGCAAYYNWRVTGSATTFPYQLYERTYAANPPLIWWPDTQRQLTYPNELMRDYYLNWERAHYLQQRSWSGLALALMEKSRTLIRAYGESPMLGIALIGALLALRRDTLIRLMSVTGVLFLFASFSGVWFFPHYAAPAAIVYFLLLIQGLRHVRAGWPYGRWIVRGCIALHVLAALFCMHAISQRSSDGWNVARKDLIAELQSDHRQHLILVRYPIGYYAHNEYVYNDADIDASHVVWARDLGETENRALLAYYPSRIVHLLNLESGEFTDYPRSRAPE